jgi:hypothetical protein
VVTTTLLTLAINLFLKILAPSLLELKLSRTMETVVGQSVPLITLFCFELYYRFHNRAAPVMWVRTSDDTKKINKELESEARQQNSFGIRVIGISMALVGSGILLLGFFSGSSKVVATVGSVIVLVAIFIFRIGNRPALKTS